ncbi:hypothetical protein [Streptomyces sp. SLBN-115]|uniref:hypothetical protein n=1 Tax=Streptomyces sp. SLBN-115 TaxID=2768453 RepID=UPI0011694FCA|nr:hypothetical protein [Streptomyces sp. SLBN-115]TQJ37689.1 hypothetical protein FBY34_7822 [Streptomyces sp. SLBN-115]
MLRAPCQAQNAGFATIASFAALEAPVANWQNHLALWAQRRSSGSGSRPLEACVVDLHAPELEADTFVDMAGLTKITAVTAGDMPDLRYGGAKELPDPQEGAGQAMRWSLPVARDWAVGDHLVRHHAVGRPH